MRRLADDLGFEAMSLYRHVANKDDILDGILDLVLAEIESPAPAGGGSCDPRSAISVNEVLAATRGLTDLLMSPGADPAGAVRTWIRSSAGCARRASRPTRPTRVSRRSTRTSSASRCGRRATRQRRRRLRTCRRAFARMIPIDEYPTCRAPRSAPRRRPAPRGERVRVRARPHPRRAAKAAGIAVDRRRGHVRIRFGVRRVHGAVLARARSRVRRLRRRRVRLERRGRRCRNRRSDRRARRTWSPRGGGGAVGAVRRVAAHALPGGRRAGRSRRIASRGPTRRSTPRSPSSSSPSCRTRPPGSARCAAS